MDLNEQQIEDFATNIKAQVPLGRFGESREVAKAFSFLLSDDASYVNGVEWDVDGGIAQV